VRGHWDRVPGLLLRRHVEEFAAPGSPRDMRNLSLRQGGAWNSHMLNIIDADLLVSRRLGTTSRAAHSRMVARVMRQLAPMTYNQVAG